MLWDATSVMDEKLRFVAACLSGEEPMPMLCERFGISRQTGYQLKRRYKTGGPSGLEEHSRPPHRPGRMTPAGLVVRLLVLRCPNPPSVPNKLLPSPTPPHL